MRHHFRPFSLAVLLWSFLAVSAMAKDPVNTTFFGNKAIEGFDPVAYFTEGKAIEGKKAHRFEWNGATWLFATAEHRDLFAADPEKYAPAYGGYCAWAVSEGYTAGIDPGAWRIVDDVLYLNYSKKVQAQWEKDIPGNIQKADANWPKILEE